MNGGFGQKVQDSGGKWQKHSRESLHRRFSMWHRYRVEALRYLFWEEILRKRRRAGKSETGKEEKPTPGGFLDLMVSGLQSTGTSEELLERAQNCLPKRRKGRT